MAQQRTPVDGLAALLAASGADYLCLSAVPDSVVRVRFLGRFQDRPVAWDAAIYTLRRYREERHAQSLAELPFIEIAPCADGSYQLTIGLDLAIIDEPAIRKAVVMVRNYKRLRVGRMEWAPRLAGD